MIKSTAVQDKRKMLNAMLDAYWARENAKPENQPKYKPLTDSQIHSALTQGSHEWTEEQEEIYAQARQESKKRHGKRLTEKEQMEMFKERDQANQKGIKVRDDNKKAARAAYLLRKSELDRRASTAMEVFFELTGDIRNDWSELEFEVPAPQWPSYGRISATATGYDFTFHEWMTSLSSVLYPKTGSIKTEFYYEDKEGSDSFDSLVDDVTKEREEEEKRLKSAASGEWERIQSVENLQERRRRIQEQIELEKAGVFDHIDMDEEYPAEIPDEEPEEMEIPPIAEPEEDKQLGTTNQNRDQVAQNKFREAVRANFNGTCPVTGCKMLACMEAAHIHGQAVGGSYDVSNGILLRIDIHRLFDRGHAWIDDNLTVQFSAEAKADPEIARLNGKRIWPNVELSWQDIDWHVENVVENRKSLNVWEEIAE